MLSLLKEKKPYCLEKIKNILRFSVKVQAYRKDILNLADLDLIQKADAHLRNLIAKDPKTIKDQEVQKAQSNLEYLLTLHGGKIYPHSFWSEHTEMFIVAAILALGIRAFFIQPFKIPTNSMYPSYAGMVPHVYVDKGPTRFNQLWNTLTLGATHYEVLAPQTGIVSIPFFNSEERMQYASWVRFNYVKGKKYFGLLPEMQREYKINVGEQQVALRVPADFSMDDVILKTFFKNASSFEEALMELSSSYQNSFLGRNPLFITSKLVTKSSALLNFDIQTGDMLFVDRLSYHFRAPKIGDAIVFKTINIKGMEALLGVKEDKYYIKRLVGIPGDSLSIDDPILYRNNKPITGTSAFDKNSKRLEGYPGYRALARLKIGKKEYVPSKHFYAMGDNSANSLDSRYWGFIPEKELVGKAIFIFYPFSKRWGYKGE